MTSILGYWQINANDSEGTFRLFLDNQGNLQGKMTFQDVQRVDDLTNISWNDAAGEISFMRLLGQTNLTQTYTGFLGDNHADQLLSLAGWFTESDIPVTAPRPRFGWFARQPQPPAKLYVAISDPYNSNPFHISVPVDEIDPNDPIVSGGEYSADVYGLLSPLTLQWTGGLGVTIISPTADSTATSFDMTGNIRVGAIKDFQIAVQVTDKLGVPVSDQKTVFVHVISSKNPDGSANRLRTGRPDKTNAEKHYERPAGKRRPDCAEKSDHSADEPTADQRTPVEAAPMAGRTVSDGPEKPV